MNPKILQMQAFGPYVEKQSIDFTDWKEQHLFLIRGETGSGKTMILDAMTYALYGKSSGGQREDLESMRSRMAEDDQKTFVDFTFTMQNREYRFYRQVEVRTKRNKEKVCKVSVDAGELIDGVFYPFFENPKLRNVEEKAEELIGLTHEQFIQVMILPQGKFERLLVSKSDEKQEILKTLFQMEHWSAINDLLVEQMRVMKAGIDEKKQLVQGYLKGVEANDVEELEEWVNKAAVREMQLKEVQGQLKLQIDNLREEVQRQNRIREWQKEAQDAVARKQQLESQRATYEQRKRDLEHQKQLQILLPYAKAKQQAEQEVQRRVNQYKEAREVLLRMEEAMKSCPEKEAQLTLLEEKLSTLDEQLSVLKEKRTFYLELQDEQTKLSAVSREEDRLSAVYTKSQNRMVQQNEKREDILRQLQIITEQLVNKSEQEEQYVTMRQAAYLHQQQVKLKQEIASLDQKLLGMQKDLKQSEDVLRTVREQHDVLYRRFLDNSALQLAELLQENEPCPVCGSLHHPHPATLHKEYVDVLQLKQLQEDMDKKKASLEACQQNLHAQTSLRDTKFQEAAGIEREIQELLKGPFSQERYIALQESVQKNQELGKQQETLHKEADRLLTLIQQQETESKALQEELQKNQIQKAKLQSRRDQLQDQLPYQLTSLAQFDAHVESLVKKRTQIAQEQHKGKEDLQNLRLAYEKSKNEAENSGNESAKASMVLQEATAVLQNLCAKHHVAIEEVNTQKSVNIDSLQLELQRYETECVQVETTLCNVQKHLDQAVYQELDPLHRELNKLEEEEKQIREESASLMTTKTMYEKIIRQVAAVSKELQEEEPKFIRRNQFVKAMRGDNGVGIERYVLGIMLSNITQSANKLLELVHDGRYQIYRSDEASGRTRKYGLELSIYDSYSCSLRSVVSLSGGEKFLVSLALSLALSAVVQARNGGVHFDAMFIDEGFGTLDEHSIADALQVLNVMGVRKGLVGIISHVELLKENISAGIEVVKSRKGSTIIMRKD